MNTKQGLSNKPTPIIAIDFATIFSKPIGFKDRFFGDSLGKMFDDRYRNLTHRLYNLDYNIYITSLNPIKQYEDKLWGHYLYFNQLVEYDSLLQLSYDCNFLYAYYIDETHSRLLMKKAYTYDEFMEVLF